MKHFLVFALATVGGLSTWAALAASPAYIGRWADSPDSCRVGEVITLTRREMNMLENGLCRFHKIGGGAGHWHTSMTCTGEGSTDDLNGDGIPEALARIESPSECGTRGCTAYVLDLSGPGVRSLGDFTAQTLKALPTKTGAWRDVALNGIKESFHAGRYVSTR